MKIQLIRHSTMRITYNNSTILTDPYLSDKLTLPTYSGRSKNPLVDLPFPIKEILDGIDLVILSHLHSDHFDPVARSVVPKDISILCQPENEGALTDMGFFNVNSHNLYVWNGTQIRRTTGLHGSGKVLEDMGKVSGFYLTAAGEPSLYWAGDTVLCDEVKEFVLRHKPDIIITHSCGAEWGDHVKIVMDEYQTVELCKLLPNSIVIAVHMESVDHATVSRKQLREYAQERRISDEQLIIPSDGEIIDFE